MLTRGKAGHSREVAAFVFLAVCLLAAWALPLVVRAAVRAQVGHVNEAHAPDASLRVPQPAGAKALSPSTERAPASRCPPRLSCGACVWHSHPHHGCEQGVSGVRRRCSEGDTTDEGGNRTSSRRAHDRQPPRQLTPTTSVIDLPPLQGNPRVLPDSMTMDDLIVHKGNAARHGLKDLHPQHLPGNRMAAMKEFKGMTCAVVGSSGNILNTSLGDAVVAHDVVVRINAAPTANFASDVGNRTDMRALSRAFTRRYALANGATREVGVLPLEWGTTLLAMGVHADEYNELVDALQDKWRRPDVELLLVTPKMVSLAKRALAEYRRRLLEDSFVLATRGNSPSAGFITTYLLMLACRSVTAYGFGPDTAGRAVARYRYFEEGAQARSKTITTAADVELALMRTLAAKGHIRLCSGASLGAADGSGCMLEARAVNSTRRSGASVDNSDETAPRGDEGAEETLEERGGDEGGGWTNALTEDEGAEEEDGATLRESS